MLGSVRFGCSCQLHYRGTTGVKVQTFRPFDADQTVAVMICRHIPAYYIYNEEKHLLVLDVTKHKSRFLHLCIHSVSTALIWSDFPYQVHMAFLALNLDCIYCSLLWPSNEPSTTSWIIWGPVPKPVLVGERMVGLLQLHHHSLNSRKKKYQVLLLQTHITLHLISRLDGHM